MNMSHWTHAILCVALLSASSAMAALDCTAKEVGGAHRFGIVESTDGGGPQYYLVDTVGAGQPNPSVSTRPAVLVRRFRLGDMLQYEFTFPFQVQGNKESATMQLDTLTRQGTWLHTTSAYDPSEHRFKTTRTLYGVDCTSL